MRPATIFSLAMVTLASLAAGTPIAVATAEMADPPVLNARVGNADPVGKADPPVLNARVGNADPVGKADPPVLNA